MIIVWIRFRQFLFNKGDGCTIGPGGLLPVSCGDWYSLCVSLYDIPMGGCTETCMQRLYVGGVLAETKGGSFGACRGREQAVVERCSCHDDETKMSSALEMGHLNYRRKGNSLVPLFIGRFD